MTSTRLQVLDLDALAARAGQWKADGRVVGLCHGCFDPLHIGHVWHFEAVAGEVDRLVVTVTPDRYVAKGPGRPLLAEAQRAEMIASIRFVDAVAINRWPTAVEVIRLLRPCVYAKGADYTLPACRTPAFLAECSASEEVGARILLTHTPKLSSTDLIAHLLHIQRHDSSSTLFPGTSRLSDVTRPADVSSSGRGDS